MFSFVFFGIVLAATFGFSSQCPEGWYHFEADNTCLKGFNSWKDFTDARKSCQSFGGDLVQIESEAKEEVVAGLTSRSQTWIGLKDTQRDGHFTYLDGSELGDYTSWANGEPDNYNGDEYCVYKYKAYWYDIPCNEISYYVCQIKIKTCADGWTHYPEGNLCIKAFDFPLSYIDAREYCLEEAADADLVQIKNEAVSNFILDLNISLKNWIGVQDANEDRVFHHLDGSGIEEYHPWNAGEPNNQGGKQNCVMMYGQGGWAGKWNDDKCNNEYPFICSEKSK